MAQINAVEAPIINSPFEEPKFYWQIEAGKEPVRRPGRRMASYFFRVPEKAARGRKDKDQAALFEEAAKGQEYLLDNANLIRQRLAEWRKREYEGATKVTRELLALWRSEDRGQRLFYAQIEAAETVLFLVEGPDDLKQGIKVPLDEPGDDSKAQGYKAFLRYALKMATGTGKTTVMGMLAAWSILNKITNQQDARYADTILIVCPNVTIRDRLAELDPNLDELSLYRTRQLVPLHRMPDLRKGEVFITNWHKLERQEMNEVNGTSAKVVRRGQPEQVRRDIKFGGRNEITEAGVRQAALMGTLQIVGDLRDAKGTLIGFTVEETRYYESDTAFIRRVLGNRKGRGASILVFNDEAHHAYRRGIVEEKDKYRNDEEDETLEADAREATVWIEGLDRINKVLGGRGNGIRLCADLSATPFYIQGSGNEVGKPFPWIVSDFSLLEAIEAGLVKIPQLPTQDAGGTKTPAYFNVWRWVQERAEEEGFGSKKLTPALIMRYATQPITQLASEWDKTAAEWQTQFEAGHRTSNVPPVFIIVCRDTSLAKEIYKWLAEADLAYGQAPDAFRNATGKEYTVRIDSKTAEEIAEGGGRDDEALRLRFVLQSIGKTKWPGGKVPEEYAALVERHNRRALEDEESRLVTLDPDIPPGRDVRCLISVAMLSEGWDATTVTHVVGLRPFGSQLLCEQVVGRALRRTSYALDDTNGFFAEETAKVFGVPFELIPFKVSGRNGPIISPPANQIYAVPAKAQYEIEFPVVDGYTDPGITQITIHWDRVPKLLLDPLKVPDSTLVQGLNGADGTLIAWGPGRPEHITLEEWRKHVRPQQVAFALTKALTQQWLKERGDGVPTHRLFPQLLGYVQQFLDTSLEFRGDRVTQDVVVNPYFQRAVQIVYEALDAVDLFGASQERPIIAAGLAGIRSTRHVEFHTGRQLYPVKRCHLNATVYDTKTWEQAAAMVLDTHARVAAWVKNDHLGFVVPYRNAGIRRDYLPDFVVRLIDGQYLVIEIKGQIRDGDVKAVAAQRWCAAVNNDGRFGRWSYHLVRHPADLGKVLRDQPAVPGEKAA